MSISLKVDSYLPAKERVDEYYSSFYRKLDLRFRYILLALFGLGVLFSYFQNTWGIAFFFPAAIFGGYFFFSHFEKNVQFQRYLLVTCLFLFQVQYTLQVKGVPFVQMIYFSVLALLTLYQSWQMITYYFVLVNIFYALISTFSDSLWTQELFSADNNIGGQAGLVTAIIMHFIFYITCMFISSYLRKQSYQNAKYAIFLEDQMYLEENLELSQHIIDGELDEEYQVEENNLIGNKLVDMKSKLKEVKEHEDAQKWISFSLTSMGELLLTIKKAEQLPRKTLKEIVVVLDASYGGMYIAEENRGETVLRLEASYAGIKRANIKDKILLGEGLVGEAALKGKLITSLDVPDSFSFINSGLGSSKPKSIMIIPMKVKDELLGVIEIGSFHEFKKHEIEFMDNVAENIAITYKSLKSAAQTKDLLEEQKRVNSHMKEQEDRLRENMEMLSEAQKEMEHRQELLKQREMESKVFFENALDAMISIDQEEYIDNINPAAEAIFKIRKNLIKDLKVTDWLGNGYEKAINNRRQMKIKRANGEVFNAQVFISEIPTKNNEVKKIAYIQDITSQIEKQRELRELLDKSQLKNEQMREQENYLQELNEEITNVQHQLASSRKELISLKEENAELKLNLNKS